MNTSARFGCGLSLRRNSDIQARKPSERLEKLPGLIRSRGRCRGSPRRRRRPSLPASTNCGASAFISRWFWLSGTWWGYRPEGCRREGRVWCGPKNALLDASIVFQEQRHVHFTRLCNYASAFQTTSRHRNNPRTFDHYLSTELRQTTIPYEISRVLHKK